MQKNIKKRLMILRWLLPEFYNNITNFTFLIAHAIIHHKKLNPELSVIYRYCSCRSTVHRSQGNDKKGEVTHLNTSVIAAVNVNKNKLNIIDHTACFFMSISCLWIIKTTLYKWDCLRFYGILFKEWKKQTGILFILYGGGKALRGFFSHVEQLDMQ